MAGAVVIPGSQLRDVEESGAPLTVGAAISGSVVQVKWFDKLGKAHAEILFVIGGVVYRDPNGERWASGLKVMNDAISDHVRTALADQRREEIKRVLEDLGFKTASTLKALADVDVMGDEIDAEAVGEASP
jgi:hypothetical protein